MQIAMVAPFRSIGGAESYSLNLSRELSRLKNQVTLFVSSSQTKELYVNENFKIKYVRSTSLPIDPGNPFSLKLLDNLASSHFDIIHVHQLFTVFNIFSCALGKMKRIKTILTDHGGGWRLAAFPRLCAKFPDAFAAVSEFSLAWLKRWAPKKKGYLVYGGVDTDLFHPNYQVEELKNKLELDGYHVILYVGRVLPHKGIEVLIRSLRFLPMRTKLLIVGPILDDRYLDYLRNVSGMSNGKKVIFTDSVETTELPFFYNVCDVFVQPSLYYDYLGVYHRLSELLGLTKLEAMACAKPVVVSKVGGLPEKVFEGRNGYIVAPGDERKLADAINILLSDEGLRKKMGQMGLSLVERELTWKATAMRVIDCYESVVSCQNPLDFKAGKTQRAILENRIE